MMSAFGSCPPRPGRGLRAEQLGKHVTVYPSAKAALALRVAPVDDIQEFFAPGMETCQSLKVSGLYSLFLLKPHHSAPQHKSSLPLVMSMCRASLIPIQLGTARSTEIAWVLPTHLSHTDRVLSRSRSTPAHFTRAYSLHWASNLLRRPWLKFPGKFDLAKRKRGCGPRHRVWNQNLRLRIQAEELQIQLGTAKANDKPWRKMSRLDTVKVKGNARKKPRLEP
ncbi:hypothetical protein BD779DRAFT_1563271 [Infundibulicybe gibba]|nr:hypothetical protein BD779DRAFT_1563271 [Infundibulicybe gibba]